MILNVPQVTIARLDQMLQPPVQKASTALEHLTSMLNVHLEHFALSNHHIQFLVPTDHTDLEMLTISMKRAVV